MTHGSAVGGGPGAAADGSEFDLPDEILAVMPVDPYEQLDLARKITSMAIASRVSRLDLEAARLRKSVAEKDGTIAELQEKLAQTDRMLQQADSRLRLALEENITLVEERDSLVENVNKLTRDLAKLETFKRQLMQSLSEDNLSKHQDTVDMETCDQSLAQTSLLKDVKNEVFTTGPATFPKSTCTENTTQDMTRATGERLSITQLPPRLTQTSKPKITSTTATPKGISANVSPKFTSGVTSPTKTHNEGIIAMSPWYPSSKQSSTSNSPRKRSTTGSIPRVDGKEFFRQARSRLSYEQFGAFLANIKELNAHKQSREETLKKAEVIFGTDNKDLYISFQGLLKCNLKS